MKSTKRMVMVLLTAIFLFSAGGCMKTSVYKISSDEFREIKQSYLEDRAASYYRGAVEDAGKKCLRVDCEWKEELLCRDKEVEEKCGDDIYYMKYYCTCDNKPDNNSEEQYYSNDNRPKGENFDYSRGHGNQ